MREKIAALFIKDAKNKKGMNQSLLLIILIVIISITKKFIAIN